MLCSPHRDHNPYVAYKRQSGKSSLSDCPLARNTQSIRAACDRVTLNPRCLKPRRVTAVPPTSVIHYGQHKGLAITNDRNAGQMRDQLRLGRLLEAEMNKNLTAKLGRYEAHLMHQLKAIRTELADHQEARPRGKRRSLNFPLTSCRRLRSRLCPNVSACPSSTL